jgi:hypothetical protein
MVDDDKIFRTLTSGILVPPYNFYPSFKSTPNLPAFAREQPAKQLKTKYYQQCVAHSNTHDLHPAGHDSLITDTPLT